MVRWSTVAVEIMSLIVRIVREFLNPNNACVRGERYGWFNAPRGGRISDGRSFFNAGSIYSRVRLSELFRSPETQNTNTNLIFFIRKSLKMGIRRKRNSLALDGISSKGRKTTPRSPERRNPRCEKNHALLFLSLSLSLYIANFYSEPGSEKTDSIITSHHLLPPSLPSICTNLFRINERCYYERAGMIAVLT